MIVERELESGNHQNKDKIMKIKIVGGSIPYFLNSLIHWDKINLEDPE